MTCRACQERRLYYDRVDALVRQGLSTDHPLVLKELRRAWAVEAQATHMFGLSDKCPEDEL